MPIEFEITKDGMTYKFRVLELVTQIASSEGVTLAFVAKPEVGRLTDAVTEVIETYENCVKEIKGEKERTLLFKFSEAEKEKHRQWLEGRGNAG